MEEIKTLLQAIHDQLAVATTEATKFVGGNKTAGTRLRKAMQEIKGKAQAVRQAVSAQKEVKTGT